MTDYSDFIFVDDKSVEENIFTMDDDNSTSESGVDTSDGEEQNFNPDIECDKVQKNQIEEEYKSQENSRNDNLFFTECQTFLPIEKKSEKPNESKEEGQNVCLVKDITIQSSDISTLNNQEKYTYSNSDPNICNIFTKTIKEDIEDMEKNLCLMKQQLHFLEKSFLIKNRYWYFDNFHPYTNYMTSINLSEVWSNISEYIFLKIQGVRT